MMKLAIILLFFCFLAGCSETVCLRNDEEPVLVLNAVLEAGGDSIRIELTETKGAYDQSPWQRFPEAEVRVYEEGELLGMAEYQPADSSFVLRQPVKAERTYRIEARVAGKGTVWGETRVPEEVADCHADLWFEHKGWGTPRWIARYRWKDIPGRENYYWFTAYGLDYNGWEPDTLTWHALFGLDCNSTLPDPFNRYTIIGEGDEGNTVFYAPYIRVADGGMDGQEIALEYYPRTGFNYGSLTKTRIVFLSLDAALDAYLKSCILADWNAMPPDVEGIWTFTPTAMYSNVHGGTGIVGSCTVEVTELRVEKAVEGLYGPGKPVK